MLPVSKSAKRIWYLSIAIFVGVRLAVYLVSFLLKINGYYQGGAFYVPIEGILFALLLGALVSTAAISIRSLIRRVLVAIGLAVLLGGGLATVQGLRIGRPLIVLAYTSIFAGLEWAICGTAAAIALQPLIATKSFESANVAPPVTKS